MKTAPAGLWGVASERIVCDMTGSDRKELFTSAGAWAAGSAAWPAKDRTETLDTVHRKEPDTANDQHLSH